MLFVVRFYDLANQQAVRARYLEQHIDWLDQRRDTILVAGSLRDSPEENPGGALWIVEAESKAAIVALMQSDPFWSNGLRASYEILHWSKAFPHERSIV